MRTRLVLLMLTLCLCAGLSGCGQKGPLVHPPEKSRAVSR